MTQEAPFRIGPRGVSVEAPPDRWRAQFDEVQAVSLNSVFDPGFLARLVERSAQAHFADDPVENVGHRAIEEPQRVGKVLSLLLHSQNLLRWIELATGVEPLKAVAGRIAEIRPNAVDRLNWHDDQQDPKRQLAIIIDLSERAYAGGQFQLRRKGESEPLLTFNHPSPGSVLIFRVGCDLEHCVMPVSSGGPRRVYAGWLLNRPEFEASALGALHL
jgi:hypothetical protein